MRIQIVDSDTGEPIFVPSANRTLETELHAFLHARKGWNPARRWALNTASKELRAAAAELRALTTGQ